MLTFTMSSTTRRTVATKGENETIILIDHDEHTVSVYSTRRRWWTRCKALGMEVEKETHGNDQRVVAMEYRAPLSKVKAGLRRGGMKRKKKIS
jgi:hypothetical protein